MCFINVSSKVAHGCAIYYLIRNQWIFIQYSCSSYCQIFIIHVYSIPWHWLILFNSEPYCCAKWFKMARHNHMTNKTGLYVRVEKVNQFTCYRRFPEEVDLPA